MSNDDFTMNKFLILIGIVLIAACSPQEKAAEEVLNVYSHRHYDADKLVFGKFEEESGIKINLVKAGADELINRLELEGANSPADVLITVDAAKLNRARDKGLLQPLQMPTLNIPEELRDPQDYWTALTFRARVIAYDKLKINPADITTYLDLSKNEWQGKVLIRSSSSVYNQSLLASVLYNEGEEVAKTWAAGIVNNMARDPKGGDRDQIKAIASGVGELAVVNTYYVGLLLNSQNPEELAAGNSVGIIFPNQETSGTHINISGIGITKHSPNRENATRFIKFLTSEDVQKIYASTSFEYPANANVNADSTIAEWGKFKYDHLNYADSLYFSNKAIEIFDEVGWK
ncbi:MAG: Fe(3+) ABC transporter substrate-binding protein [Cyclobacteriaceae bacterium]|nr:Fe(3+) ABC transporter substrate-binding protein [Cyclobacteriaceae bacterium HetDA_MAG_MS6]